MKKKEVPAPEQEVPQVDGVIENDNNLITGSEVEETIIPAPEQEVPQVQEPLTHTTTAVLSTVIATAKPNTGRDPNIVDIVINYPEGYTGQKFFKEGEVKEISKEGAEHLIKKGIAVYKK
jgi:hypothetical protein